MAVDNAEQTVTSSSPSPSSSKPGLLKSFIAGGVGGMCLVFTGHPLDTIKVRIQTMEIIAGKPPLYAGVFDCFQKTVKAEGFTGLYRGMAAPMYGVTPMYALCFFGYGVGQKIFCTEDSFKELRVLDIALAGATSGLFTTPILAPGERMKCMLQVQGAKVASGEWAKPKYAGPIDVIKKLYAEGGLKSVNRGFSATMARDSIASAFYFSSYEVLKARITPEGKEGPGIAGTLLCGGLAGMFNWSVALPLDTLKSRLQVAEEGKYVNGIRSVFTEVMRTEGPAGLYRGFGAVMLRAFPSNAACFLGYETALKCLTHFGVE